MPIPSYSLAPSRCFHQSITNECVLLCSKEPHSIRDLHQDNGCLYLSWILSPSVSANSVVCSVKDRFCKREYLVWIPQMEFVVRFNTEKSLRNSVSLKKKFWLSIITLGYFGLPTTAPVHSESLCLGNSTEHTPTICWESWPTSWQVGAAAGCVTGWAMIYVVQRHALL